MSLALITSVTATNLTQGNHTTFNQTSVPINNSVFPAMMFNNSIGVGLEIPYVAEMTNVYSVPVYGMYDMAEIFLYASSNGTPELYLECYYEDFMGGISMSGVIAVCNPLTQTCDVGFADQAAASNCYGHDLYYYVNTIEGTIEVLWDIPEWEIDFDDYDPAVISTIYNITDYLELDGLFYEDYNIENGSSNYSYSYRTVLVDTMCGPIQDCMMIETPMECDETPGCFWNEEYCDWDYYYYNESNMTPIKFKNSTSLNETRYETSKDVIAAGLEKPTIQDNNDYIIPIDTGDSLIMRINNTPNGTELGIACNESGELYLIAYEGPQPHLINGIIDEPAKSHCGGYDVFYFVNTEDETIELVWELNPAKVQYDDEDSKIISTIQNKDYTVELDGDFLELYQQETGSSGTAQSHRLKTVADMRTPIVRIKRPLPGQVLDNGQVLLQGHIEHPDDIRLMQEVDEIKLYVDGKLKETYNKVKNFSKIVTLEHGEHNIRVEAKSKTGVVGVRERMFFVDLQAPQIDLIFPAEGSTIHNGLTMDFRVKDLGPVICGYTTGGEEGYTNLGTRKRYHIVLDEFNERQYTVEVACIQGNQTSFANLTFTINYSEEVLVQSIQDYIDTYETELNTILQELMSSEAYNKELAQAMQVEDSINKILANLSALEKELVNISNTNYSRMEANKEDDLLNLLDRVRAVFGQAPAKVMITKRYIFQNTMNTTKREELLEKAGNLTKMNSNPQTAMSSTSVEYANGTVKNMTTFTITVRIGGKNYEVTIETDRVDYDSFNPDMFLVTVGKITVGKQTKYELIVELNKNITGTNDLNLCGGGDTCNLSEMDQSVFKVYVDNGVEFTIVDADPIVKWSFNAPKAKTTVGGGGGGGSSAAPTQQNTTTTAPPAPVFKMPEVKEEPKIEENKKEAKTNTNADKTVEEKEANSNKVTGGFFANIPPIARFGAVAILIAIAGTGFFLYRKFS